jgi:hypothetical protein
LMTVRIKPLATSKSLSPDLVASLRPMSFGKIVGRLHKCDHVSGAVLQETHFHSSLYKSGLLCCGVTSSGSSSKINFAAQVSARFWAKEVCCDGINMSYCRQNSVQSQLMLDES